jgi:hypothetical protein
MPIVEQARKHTPDNDRCVSQYGLPVDERGRSVEVSSATEACGGPSEGRGIELGSQARRRPTQELDGGLAGPRGPYQSAGSGVNVFDTTIPDFSTQNRTFGCGSVDNHANSVDALRIVSRLRTGSGA